MARILILTFGSRGDVQPFVALGSALARRGHDVTVSTGRGFDDLIDGQGLVSMPLSIDLQAILERSDVRAAMKSMRGWVRAFRSSQALMQRQLDEMWAVTRQVAPQVIVYHPKAFIAPYFARRLGAIAIPGFLQPAFVPTGSFANPLLPLPDLGALGNRLSGRTMAALMRFGYRSLLGKWLPRHSEVPARPRLDVIAGYHPAGGTVPRLHAHSRHIVAKPPDWGNDDHVTGYWFVEPDPSWTPPPDLAQFLATDPTPVYVGFGSMPDVEGEGPASAVVDALTNTGTRGILARGWGALSAAAPSDTIHIVDSAPHDWLLPRCSAAIHHGGAGTTHEALRWGRPNLVCPVFGDQPFWGRRVASLGAGPAPIRLKALTADRLTSALQTLQSEAMREAARSLGERIRSEDGAGVAADLVEGTFGERVS